MSKRANFKTYLDSNYKRYFYCIDKQVDLLIKSAAEENIKKLIKKRCGDADYIDEK